MVVVVSATPWACEPFDTSWLNEPEEQHAATALQAWGLTHVGVLASTRELREVTHRENISGAVSHLRRQGWKWEGAREGLGRAPDGTQLYRLASPDKVEPEVLVLGFDVRVSNLRCEWAPVRGMAPYDGQASPVGALTEAEVAEVVRAARNAYEAILSRRNEYDSVERVDELVDALNGWSA